MDIYKNYSIYELRNIGRNKGVKNPTTLRRADLINEINKIDRGEVLPYVKKTKQGRPTKGMNNIKPPKIEFNENCVKQNFSEIINFLNDLKVLTYKLHYEISSFINIYNNFSKEE